MKLSIKDKKLQISNGIQQALNYYAESTASFKYLREGLMSLEPMREAAEDTPFEFPIVDRFFQIAENQALNIIYAYFIYRTSMADFDRYTWHGEHYKTVSEYQINEIPAFLKRVKQAHTHSGTELCARWRVTLGHRLSG